MSEAGLQPIATEVLYEDDEVCVWDQPIGTGETLCPISRPSAIGESMLDAS